MRCGRSRASLLWRSLATGIPLPLPFLSGASYSPMAPPASSIFATAAFPACLFAIAVPRPASLPLRTGRSAALPQRPGQQHLPDGALPHCSRPAAPPRRPGQQLCHCAPAGQQLCRSAQASKSSATAPVSSSATAPLPATNLIWRRRVLRFG